MTPFACDMSAIPPAERQQHIATMQTLFAGVQEIRELADGYGFLLAGDEAVFMEAAEFVAKERMCCPFFGFRIEIESGGGPIWLHLLGRNGIKPFIREEIGGALPEDLARDARFVGHA